MPKRSRSITPTLSKPVSSSAKANGVASGSGTELAATPLNESPQKSKKLKLLSTYASKSPFPDWAHPTPEEAKSVHAVLCEAHPQYAGKRVAPREENDAAKTCGKVPNVLESLIGTILSQNTSARNSTAAKASLDKTFGRNNFAKIAAAPKAEVVEALKMGGLANKKAGVIQSLLEEVKERHGDYSLQHLSKATDEEVMNELVSYDGVGPKTASCVLLFCLSRDSFAVDTHVFRLTRLLGWVPPRADRVLAQAHLDQLVPTELKYGLHVLFVHHGRNCAGCKNAAGRGKPCPLKTWMKERGVKDEEVEGDLVKADEDTKNVVKKEEVKKEEDEVVKQKMVGVRRGRSKAVKKEEEEDMLLVV